MTIRLASILLCLGLFSSSAFSQTWDFRTWHKLKAGGKLTKDLSGFVEHQLRLEENSTRVNETFTEVGLEYDLPKGFDVGAAYRLGWSPDRNNVYSSEHRYNVDLIYGKKFWKLEGKARVRFQHRPSASSYNERLEPDDSPMIVRFKASIAYRKLKKLKPGFEFELFARTDLPEENGINRFRYKVFLDVDLPKRQELSVFYMLQTNYDQLTPAFLSIAGVSFSYEWKRPKRKKKK